MGSLHNYGERFLEFPLSCFRNSIAVSCDSGPAQKFDHASKQSSGVISSSAQAD